MINTLKGLAFCITSFAMASILWSGEAPVYPEHFDLLYYIDSDGRPVRISDSSMWPIRRAHIIQNMQDVMGNLPSEHRRCSLDVAVLEEHIIGDVIRRKITYLAEPGDRVPAYLFLPKAKLGGRLPAVVCLHQTTDLGKGEPAGLGTNTNLQHALELSRRGYVTIAPDYPRFGEYQYRIEEKGDYASSTMKGIWNHIRAIDLLQALDEVDPQRIGCIGHSLGGHNAMFLAAFDPRVRAVVSSCGFTSFLKDDVPIWASHYYMPRIQTRYHNSASEIPFDFAEVIAAIAPRAFFSNSPLKDSFNVDGARDCLAAAQTVYTLFGKSDHLQYRFPDSDHGFPSAIREEAYEFLDLHLGNQTEILQK